MKTKLEPPPEFAPHNPLPAEERLEIGAEPPLDAPPPDPPQPQPASPEPFLRRS